MTTWVQRDRSVMKQSVLLLQLVVASKTQQHCRQTIQRPWRKWPLNLNEMVFAGERLANGFDQWKHLNKPNNGAFPKTQKHKLCPSSIADVAIATSRRHHQSSVSIGHNREEPNLCRKMCSPSSLNMLMMTTCSRLPFVQTVAVEKNPRKTTKARKTMKATEIQPVASYGNLLPFIVI